jgi:hypothetical protein
VGGYGSATNGCGGLARHFNLDAIGCVADDDSGKQRHPLPGFILGNFLTIANYKRTFAFQIPFGHPFRP